MNCTISLFFWVSVSYSFSSLRAVLLLKRGARALRCGRVNVIYVAKTFVYPIVVHFVGSGFVRNTNFPKIINVQICQARVNIKPKLSKIQHPQCQQAITYQHEYNKFFARKSFKVHVRKQNYSYQNSGS